MSAALPDAAFRAALALEGSDSLPAIQDRVRTFAAPLGYDRFVLFSATAEREGAVERIYWCEGDWLGDGVSIDADTYIRRCPVTRHVFDAREPFFWTKTGQAGGELYRVVRTPRGRGIHGLQLPVFGPLGLEGAMSMAGVRIDASAAARLALSTVAVAAFFATRRLREGAAVEAGGRLSGREREVLSWTAAGLRQAEIAATLDLSERTVENHLRRIRKRLGVATTAQAVRVAIRNGDI